MQSCIIPSLRKRPDVFIQKKARPVVFCRRPGFLSSNTKARDSDPTSVECDDLAGQIGVFSS